MESNKLNFDLHHTTTLTKDLILSKIREEEIGSFYGVQVNRGLFCSKLRHDKHPTCSLYRNKSGRLIMKDFGSSGQGDCFAYVSELYQLSYIQTLRLIANDFGIINNPKLIKNKPILKYDGTTIVETKQAIIQVEIRPFQEYELKGWLKFGITEKTLKKFKVFSCKNIGLNGNLFHIEKEGQLVFGYYGGTKDGIELGRIYFPGRKTFRFVSNGKKNKLQGAHMLPKEGGELLCITKSLKDVMLLYELGIPAIAPCSENLFLTDKQYEALRPNFEHCIVCFDNDRAGITNLNVIKRKYPELICTCIPRKGGSKDISDFYKAHGKKKTIELINEGKEYYLNGGKEKRKNAKSRDQRKETKES